MGGLFYQRKNGANLKTLLIRFGQFSIGSLGAAVLNLILIPVTTYFLTPEEYGKTSMFILAQTLLIYIVYLGYDQAFTREFYEYNNKKRLLFQAMLIPLLFSIILILGMCFFAESLSTWLFADPMYTHAIYLLAISSVLLIFERFILLFVRMENKAIRFSLYSIIIKLAILLGTVCALLIGPATFITVIYGMLIGQMIGDFILIIMNLTLFTGYKGSLDRQLIKRLTLFGVPVVVGTFLYSLFIVIDKLFLRYFSDFNEIGIYTAAFKIASALMVLQVSFSNFWIPTAYEWYQQKKPILYYKKVSDAVMFSTALFFLVMLFFKEWIVLFILSPAYSEAQYVFPFLCFYPIMMTVSETTNLGIVFLKKSIFNIFVSASALIVAIALNFMLVPTYGAIGASISTGTAYIVFFFARTYFSMRIWEGFSVKRHLFVTGLLYSLALWSIVFHQDSIEKLVILLSIILLVFLYKKEISYLWNLKTRKERKNK